MNATATAATAPTPADASDTRSRSVRAIPLPAFIRNPLLRLRRRARALAAGEGVAALLLAACALLAVQIALDWFFEAPRWVRAAWLAADAVLLAALYLRDTHARLWRKPALSRVALLVERRWPELGQCLVTSVELAEGGAHSSRGAFALVEKVFWHTRKKLRSLDFREAAPPLVLRRRAAAALAALALFGALLAAAGPASGVLLRRVILLSTEPLPRRTAVEAITGNLVVAVGGDIELSARAKGEVPRGGRLLIHRDGAAAQEAALLPVGDVFTRKISGVQSDFRYTFLLGDGRGAEFRVTARRPPSLTLLRFEEHRPAYTKLSPRPRAPSDLTLLAGGRLKISLTANEPLSAAFLLPTGADVKPVPLAVSGENATGEFLVPAKNLTGLAVRLVSKDGFATSGETVYPVNLTPDNPPELRVLDNLEATQTVVLKAKPTVVFTADDDYGLAALRVVWQLLPPAGATTGAGNGATGATGAKPGARAPRRYYATLTPKAVGNAAAPYRHMFDLPALDAALSSGWTVSYWIEAEDNNTATGPGITKTTPRQLRVVTPAEKQAEILERVRRSSTVIESTADVQRKLGDDVAAGAENNASAGSENSGTRE
ncbi:MAG: DUF4175 domain-containing protein [Puniceicoccales bacterium]|jgi:hypothetical protein|nr:DUF4175 domain-containing protein [Puniceicoccales bacterium]